MSTFLRQPAAPRPLYRAPTFSPHLLLSSSPPPQLPIALPLPSPMPLSLHFNPSPSETLCVLNDLSSTTHSLENIAHNYDTTVEAVLAWIARPDITEKLNASISAAALRSRLVAAVNMTEAVTAVVTMLAAYNQDELRDNSKPGPATSAFNETRRANARRAANLLLRLGRFYAPPSPSLSSRESRRLCGGEGFASSPSSIAQEPAAPAHTAVDHLPDAALSALLSPRAITLAGSSRQSGAPDSRALTNTASDAESSLSRSSGRVAVLGGEGFVFYSPSNSRDLSAFSQAPVALTDDSGDATVGKCHDSGVPLQSRACRPADAIVRTATSGPTCAARATPSHCPVDPLPPITCPPAAPRPPPHFPPSPRTASIAGSRPAK